MRWIRVALRLAASIALTACGPGGKIRLLAKIAAKISSMNKPFVIGLDGNMTPAEFRNTGWPGNMRATVVAPQTPTCGNKSYGYFVMSEGLVGSIIHVKAL